MSFNSTVLEIDSSVIIHNLAYFKSKLQSKTKILVVIKAFGYGGDSVAIAKILEEEGIDYLAVAYTAEGIALRKANVKLPILVLHPQKGKFESLITYNLEPNIYNFNTLSEFLFCLKKKDKSSYPIHIKINSGMNRLGFKPSEISKLMDKLSHKKALKIKSIYSHLSASEDPNEKEFTLNQIETFLNVYKELSSKLGYNPIKHIVNTSGIINYKKAHFDMVRLGIGLYGFANNKKENQNLLNAYSLKTHISQIQFVEKGESVGYNRVFKAGRKSKIAIIPIGYADGLNRKLGNGKACVYIKNSTAQIIGNICMDICMINVTNINCKEGDEVVIFNHQNHILEMAKKLNTIPYEILTSISQRVPRKVI